MVLNYGPQPQLRPQYCSFCGLRNRIATAIAAASTVFSSNWPQYYVFSDLRNRDHNRNLKPCTQQIKLMAKIINVRIILLVIVLVVAATMPQSTEAEEHVVGGAAGWITPREGASFYSTSVANITFTLNDILVFNFQTGVHNVVTLSKKNYDNCNVNDNMELFNTGPARITLNRTGEFYFACALPTHCTSGQKLTINVTATATASSSSPAPAEAPLSPPRPGAAMSVVATFSVLLIAIAINVLF